MSAQEEAGRERLYIDNMFLCSSTFTRVGLKDAAYDRLNGNG